MIDLRSDTLTKPTQGMRLAMLHADVGDDVYGEDPTARKLEETVADLLGKESALFVPSGTMSNQLALLTHCRPGDEVIVGEGAHLMFYESGAGAALAGVQFAVAGSGGFFEPDDLEKQVKPRAYYHPRTSLVTVEDTHNRAGGRVWSLPAIAAVQVRARQYGLRLHLDGARLWNACCASGNSAEQRVAGFDSISVCLSKGLGAPIGSVLVGDRDFIRHAHRLRKMLGGGMRQVGILAAAGLYALEHHRDRLAEDHAHAFLLAQGLVERSSGRIRCDLAHVETNIVRFSVTDASRFCEQAKLAGVLLSPLDSTHVRAVLHLDISRAQVEEALTRLSVIES